MGGGCMAASGEDISMTAGECSAGSKRVVGRVTVVRITKVRRLSTQNAGVEAATTRRGSSR
jgi:hypothetical protein